MSPEFIPLPIERFDDDDDVEFRVKSKPEMLSILQEVANHGEPVTLYYNYERDATQASMIGEKNNGVWLDLGPLRDEDHPLLHSDEITFVGMYQQIKVQFVASEIHADMSDKKLALYLKLPEYILRILRRGIFRAEIPADEPVNCVIPTPYADLRNGAMLREIPVLDISGDGVRLLCNAHENTLMPGKIFRDCVISLPKMGYLRVTIIVKNSQKFTTPEGIVRKRLGCSFILMHKDMDNLLQRYILYLQGASMRAKNSMQ